ncbi:MAG TPA: hypothetical protein VK492_00365 [Chitinophagaceae bacterium]|nr:hypothetical protein [Chitinophagaceae bacterium]
MKGQVLKILFKEDMAFLTQEVALNFTQVQISDRPVKFKAPAFWTIRVINYIENERRLFVEVLAYQVGESGFSPNQIQLAEILISIEKVTFKSIDTSGLLRTLNSTQHIKILPPQMTTYRDETKIEREPLIKTYTESFSIPIKNVTFLTGGVSFEKKIEQFKRSLLFQIQNENIIEEYDAIKDYFANVLDTKKINVVATIKTVDGIVTSINARSNEIDKIDKTLIEEVKFKLLKVARTKEVTSDQQVFTMEEYLETFAEEIKSTNIFKDDTDFFENVLERTETKHYKQLRFLSSKHKFDLLKLRIVHKPFSFIFLLSGINNFHIVWETLDTTEATYIWTFTSEEKDLDQIIVDIDNLVNLVKRTGRNEYLDRNEINFNRVFHDYTDLQNGFKNWKENIEKVIL